MKQILFLITLCFLSLKSFAQNAEIDANKGIMVPRFSSTFISTMTTQPKGTVVFDETLNLMKYWDGSTWKEMGGASTGGSNWLLTGSDINNANSGKVGIGISPTKAKLEVASSTTTNAVFGSNSTGISLQQNWPTIGFNQYRDDANVQRYIGTGYAMGNFFDPTTGTMYWNRIGTGNASDLTSPETNSMYLDNSGNLGIGYIKASQQALGVKIFGGNDISPIVSNAANMGSLKIGSITPSNGGPILLLGSQELLLDRNSIQSRGSSFNFLNGTTLFESPLRLNPWGGRVGINSGSISLTANLEVYRASNSNGGTAVFKGTTHYSHFHFGTNEDTYIRGGKDGSAIILNDGALGNVGIGVFPSAYKLEVNGTVRAKEVIVETGWADYVFENNYKLKSIYDLEKFIKINKHLPNIPPAADIEKNGLKVGETNKAMMEKIEELTLYIINLKKEIDTINANKN